MELKKIKIDICPHCGAEAILEERLKRDIIDNATEYKSFECGLKLTSISGDDKIIVVKHCPNDEKYKKIQSKRVDALKYLYGFIDSMDVDNIFKNNIRSTLLKNISSEGE